MKKISLTLLLALTPLFILAQDSYYIKESRITVGIRIVDGGEISNSKVCLVVTGGKVVELTPYDVDEYGFGNRVYFSEKIKINDSDKRVFLERLVAGAASLYYYRAPGITLFFLRKFDGRLIEIPPPDTRLDKKIQIEILRDLTEDCEHTSDIAELVSYNKKSMVQFVNFYNNCKPGHFAYTRYGIVAGVSANRFSPAKNTSSQYLSNINYSLAPQFSLGVFVDRPVFPGDFSYNISLYLSRFSENHYEIIDNQYVSLVVNSTSLQMPVLLRYTYPSLKIRPFLNAGGSLWYDIINESGIYKTNTISEENNIIELPYSAPGLGAGFSIGTGVEYKFNHRNSLFLELRYTKKYGIGSGDTYSILLNRAGIQLITGINL